MKFVPVGKMFTPPPQDMAYGEVKLRFDGVVPAQPEHGLSPYYHFRVLSSEGVDVGHLNFRVGDSEHVLMYAGHIGFEIEEAFRGHHYAFQACCALGPFVRQIYPAVIITCNPDNHPSRKTIEKLGATFINEVAVPAHDIVYQQGARWKRRYEWKP